MLSKAVPPFLKILSSETGSKVGKHFKRQRFFAIKMPHVFLASKDIEKNTRHVVKNTSHIFLKYKALILK